MGPTTALVVYLVIWWLVLFLVLPWGRRTAEPPRLFKKIAATTVISGVVFGLVYLLAETGLVDFKAGVS